MELGDGAEAFCLASNSRNGEKALMGDGELKGLGDVCSVGSCRDAHVGGAEEACLEVGDGENSRETDFFKVGCRATTSSIAMHTETRAHSPCADSSSSSQTDCKPCSNIDSETSCEVSCVKAISNELEAGNIVCAGGSYPHRLFDSRIDCETALYTSFRKGDCSERSSCNGTEGFYEVCNADEACNSGLGCLSEAGNGKFHGWVSPRISFSRDFVMAEAVPNNSQSISSRLSPEKRKWDQQDDDSHDFEFLRCAPTREGTADPANGFMLSADELFFNGKLLPVPFCNHLAPCDDFYLPSTSEQHHQQSAKLSLYKSNASRPMARHLSFELSKPHCTTSHITFSCTTSPSRAPEGGSSSCAALGLHSSSSSSMSTSSLSKLSSLVPSSSPTMLSSPSSKYSAKLKEIFKLKKVSTDSLPSELSRDNSFTSCRLPISPRSFWPFARSSSICDSKASTARRRILEMDAASLTSIPSQNVDGNQGEKPCSSSTSEPAKIEGHMASINEETSGLFKPTSAGEASNAEASLESQAHIHSPLNNVVDAPRERNLSMVASRLRESSSSSEVLKKKTSATSSFARGSPGRRGGTKKLNTGKVVLRNLERCSAEKRLNRDEWKGLSKRNSYCAATRVSPVLNVAIYRGGNASKNGFFSFGSLFSSRKNKKPMEATSINWRKGA